ncbi:MAG: hypothetical protein ABR521_02935 [Gaiellaceae bacterium]
MTPVNPSLLAMLGKGFRDDPYAIDGNHLRWQFDPRLGFPRHAFCVELRPSVRGDRPPRQLMRMATFQLPAGTPPRTTSAVVLPEVEARRPGGSLSQSVTGVALGAAPVVIDFTGPLAHACWVRLRLVLRSPGGAVTAEAVYLNRGQPEVVDRASRRLIRRPPGGVLDPDDVLGPLTDRLAALLARPQTGQARPILSGEAVARLYRQLVAIDAVRFGRAAPAWLRAVADALADLDVKAEDVGPDLTVPVTVDLVLSAARIDRVSVTGARGHVERVSWIRTEDLMTDGGWKPVGCFPAATDEPDYRERNAALLGAGTAAELAKERVLGHGPVGAEPLDDPVVPPERPASDTEKFRRYVDPWVERLEPWLAQVLDASRGGGLHQSEVTVSVPLDDAGQRRGAGIAGRLAAVPPMLTISPYEIVYAAGLVGFPTALVLGLGAVHRDPGEELLDYRVRGRWLVEDLHAWVGACERRLQEQIASLPDATEHELGALQAEVAAASQELTDTTAAVDALVAGAAGDELVLFGLAIGVRPGVEPSFTAPAAVAVAADGLGLPPDHAHQATVAVRWALRQRARVIDDTTVPTGACIARTADAASGRLDDVRNPNDAGDETSPPVAILPSGPAGAAGSAGEAVFGDRYADDGVEYLYGVSECDPFGRWSPFALTGFRWDDLTPPLTPAQVTAELTQEGTPLAQVLRVRFAWPLDLADPAGSSFDVHLRRTAPPSGAPVDRAAWGRFERIDGTAPGPVVFDAGFEGTTTHDGMEIAIRFDDEVRATPSGPQDYRTYELTATGVVVPFDANDRAQAWAAVGTINAKGIPSDDLGGPAKAEDFIVVPPPPPVFPPEPLLATFPDADRRSSVTLTWPAPAGRRSVVYRAGEHDLVAMAGQRGIATTWSLDDPPALRSAAIRDVAPQLRDAFAPVSELLPAGTAAHTDGLDGGLRSLVLYTVVGHSPALVPGPWPADPDGFVAVAVPKIPAPTPPVLVRSAWTAAGVELAVAEPPDPSAVGAYEVYRVLESAAERARDPRQMRPCGRTAVTPDSFVERPSGPPRVVTLRDDDAVLPWVAYLYRVVARASAPGSASRSEPSAVARVVTLSGEAPQPPVVDGATGAAAGTDLLVAWTATAPDGPAGRFRFEVRDPAGPITLARVDAADVRDAADPERYSIAVADRGDAADVEVVMVDPAGRRAASAAIAVVLT